MSAETFILCGITVTFDLQIRDIVHSLHYGNGKVIVVYDKVVTAKEISA